MDIFITEIHLKPPKIIYPTNEMNIEGIDDIWRKALLDLNDVDQKKNDECFSSILVVIDNFSQYGWTSSSDRMDK